MAIDILDRLELTYIEVRPFQEWTQSDKTAISAVTLADAMHEIKQLRRVISLVSEEVPRVRLDDESIYCLKCRRVLHELEEHDCSP